MKEDLLLKSLIDNALQRYRSAPDLVASVLREAILKGLLKGGQQLKQDNIAAWFGVSRIPVREALRELEAEGLITLFPNRGAQVAELSAEEAREIYEIRILLETAALEWAVPQLEREDIDHAQKILDALDNEKSPGIWSRLNWEFHASLYRPAKRPRLLTIIGNLHVHVSRYLVVYLSAMNYHEQSQEEHKRLLAACREKDVAQAVKCLAEHLTNASTLLSLHLPKRESNPNARGI